MKKTEIFVTKKTEIMDLKKTKKKAGAIMSGSVPLHPSENWGP